ncbi:MAG: 3-methyl-2-oxobutanoate hydroxymethyltransferase, partial [Aliivibrio sp.]|nr:3-methyl-2-oxobutanoate hydroxymethyltransferase [Aliivibrio sp.]
LEAAGAQIILLECVPASLAERITKACTVPVIGIGAGNVTDGQILVMHDMFGISANYMPKFSKNFLAETGDMRKAVTKYIQDVEQGVFPAAEHTFN